MLAQVAPAASSHLDHCQVVPLMPPSGSVSPAISATPTVGILLVKDTVPRWSGGVGGGVGVGVVSPTVTLVLPRTVCVPAGSWPSVSVPENV